MTYNSYEEYMNNLLGISKNVEPENSVQENIVINNIEVEKTENKIDTYDLDDNRLEELYPDIYKIIYPIVCKRCLNVEADITEELVEDITNEIYDVVEKNQEQSERKEIINYNSYNNMRNFRNYRNTPKVEEQKIQKETRQRNYLLNDLIKILVLRELIGSGRRPPRPNPPRPPMPKKPEKFPPPPPRPIGRPPRF